MFFHSYNYYETLRKGTATSRYTDQIDFCWKWIQAVKKYSTKICGQEFGFVQTLYFKWKIVRVDVNTIIIDKNFVLLLLLLASLSL